MIPWLSASSTVVAPVPGWCRAAAACDRRINRAARESLPRERCQWRVRRQENVALGAPALERGLPQVGVRFNLIAAWLDPSAIEDLGKIDDTPVGNADR